MADIKNHLSEVVDRLQREHGRVIITRHGHAAAVVMSVDDLESLEETLDVMDSAALLGDIRESLAEMSTAELPVLTMEKPCASSPATRLSSFEVKAKSGAVTMQKQNKQMRMKTATVMLAGKGA